MKTCKPIVGIISIVLFAIVILQSCVVGLGNAVMQESDSSGMGGFSLAFCMLIAGIVGIATRNSRAGGLVAGCFYLLGGLFGLTNLGNFGDLIVWSVLCLIFSILFILGSLLMKKPAPPLQAPQEPRE